MNVYEKLNQARVELQNMKLKKSGSNQNIAYYELSDLLPAINSICAKTGLLIQFSITNDEGLEKAILTVINAQEPKENIIFTSPTESVSLPRGQAIQGLGAKITYMRRYMIMIAFEVVESDMVDSINQELTTEISDLDMEAIKSCDGVKKLEDLYTEFSKKYKIKLLVPVFKEAKEKLAQEESKA